MIRLFSQLAVGAFLLGGWAFWVWYCTGKQKLTHRGWWIWCLLGGVAIHTLLLQQLWYFGLQLSITAWGSGLIALFGNSGWWIAYFRASSIQRYRASRLFKAAIGLTLIVCTVHGWSVMQRGPGHYYGRAEYDQFNYVITAEFLKEHVLNKNRAEVSNSPLLLKAAEASAQRITQSVLHAELAVLSSSDAQESYGVLVLLFLLLLGLAAMGYLLELNVGIGAAAAGGTMVAILPAVTTVQLNCFLSQTSVLWALLAIPGVLARRRLSGSRIIVAGGIAGFVLGAYTEIAPFAFGTAFLSIVLIAPRFKIIRLFGLLVLVALGLNLGFLGRAGDFFVSQLTEGRDATRLASWFPGSGTWAGFGRNFAPELSDSVVALVGILTGVFFLISFWQVSTPLRRRLTILVALPLVALGVLLVLPTFPAYIYGKLLVSTSPLVLTVMIVGALKSKSSLRPACIVFLGFLTGLSLWDAAAAQKEIVAGTDKIDRVDVRTVVQIPKGPYTNVEKQPTFLISAEDALSAGWLSYYCRDYRSFLVYQEMSDRIYPAAWHNFRRPPAGLSPVYSADIRGLSAIPEYDPYPNITVRGGTLQKKGVIEIWDSVSELTFDFHFTRAKTSRLEWFCFYLNPGIDPGLQVVVDTTRGTGVVSTGHKWAVPARMDTESYKITLHSTTRQPFSITLFGLEPVHQPVRLPFQFEQVQLSFGKPSS